jgi:hypothetical protein
MLAADKLDQARAGSPVLGGLAGIDPAYIPRQAAPSGLWWHLAAGP